MLLFSVGTLKKMEIRVRHPEIDLKAPMSPFLFIQKSTLKKEFGISAKKISI